uniref:Uncharacterized protein n=1 Tax=Arundo donax TaxID=35708 RepID=A0A0A9H6R5_ARUDO
MLLTNYNLFASSKYYPSTDSIHAVTASCLSIIPFKMIFYRDLVPIDGLGM